jgi:glycine cleavage system H lipoate-binding protein
LNIDKVKKATVDADQGLFKLKEIPSKIDYDYLKQEGYKEYSFYSILDNKKERYLIRPRFKESPQHYFMIFDISNYLKKFTDKVWLFETRKPDIIFKVNNRTFAIEVETGSLLKHNKRALKEKVITNNRVYGNDWFFMMTNKKLTNYYSKLAPTCDKRTIINKINRLIKNS